MSRLFEIMLKNKKINLERRGNIGKYLTGNSVRVKEGNVFCRTSIEMIREGGQ